MQTVEAESAELEPFGPPQTLFTITDSTNTNPEEIGGFSNWGASYDVSDDGSEFLMIYHAANRNADEIVIVQNWITELERLLPSDRF